MKMILDVAKLGSDTFTDANQFAYKDGKLYKILESTKSYMVGSCLGHMRVIVDNNEVIEWIYPLMSGREYEILDENKISHFKKVLKAVEAFENNGE